MELHAFEREAAQVDVVPAVPAGHVERSSACYARAASTAAPAMARKLANVLIWLSLTAEVEGFVFHGMWDTWLTAIGTFIFRAQFLHLIPWDLLVVGVIAATHGSRKNRVLAMNKTLWVSCAGLFLIWVWGIVRGGNAHQTVWQLHNYVAGTVLVAFMVMNTCRTRAHVQSLANVVMLAMAYRVGVLLSFYFAVARDLEEELPYLTEHTDSILFVAGIYVAVATALEEPSRKRVMILLGVTVLAFTAIVLNNRRIAWLSVGVGALMTYLVFPPGPKKRRLTRVLIGLSPLFAVYVAVGWNHPTGIFKPVGSITSMFGAKQDMSSIMRDIENFNLILTLRTNALFGMGWGHEYIERIVAIDISAIFPQYRFMPHNSLLGLISFTGMVGFAMIWQCVVTGVYMHARVLRESVDPILRACGLWSIVATVAVVVQFWGDIGFNHLGCNTLLGVALGLAGRTPALAGIWPGTGPTSAAVDSAPTAVPVGHQV